MSTQFTLTEMQQSVWNCLETDCVHATLNITLWSITHLFAVNVVTAFNPTQYVCLTCNKILSECFYKNKI